MKPPSVPLQPLHQQQQQQQQLHSQMQQPHPPPRFAPVPPLPLQFDPTWLQFAAQHPEAVAAHMQLLQGTPAEALAAIVVTTAGPLARPFAESVAAARSMQSQHDPSAGYAQAADDAAVAAIPVEADAADDDELMADDGAVVNDSGPAAERAREEDVTRGDASLASAPAEQAPPWAQMLLSEMVSLSQQLRAVEQHAVGDHLRAAADGCQQQQLR